MTWDTIGFSKGNYRLSIEETDDGFVLIDESLKRHDGRAINFTREEASNLVRFLRHAEQACIDRYSFQVSEND